MNLSMLASILDGQLIGVDTEFSGVNIDSRSIKAGAIFIAIKGEHFDGHTFIEQAKKNGAVAALVEKTVSCELPTVLVADTRKALGTFATLHRQRFSIPVIAITGSCGKTTTKEMLRAILSESDSVLANIKSFNNDIGVPLTLLDLNAHHRFAVIEMGANNPGEISYLSQLTKPDIALITNIGPAHLQGFGSIENVAHAKSEIFLGLSKQGVAVINADDEFEKSWKTRLGKHSVIRFGLKQKADFSAKDIFLDTQGRVKFVLMSPQGEIPIQLPLLGYHHLLNALAASAVASQVGISLEQIKSGLEKMQNVSGRLTIIKNKMGASVIDDTYNANPRSVAVALQLLAHYPHRRIFVMGDMVELGDNTKYYHRQIGELAKELGIETVYTCGKLTASTVQAFGAAGKHYASQEALIQALRPLLKENVTVLVKGSRKSQMEKVVAALID